MAWILSKNGKVLIDAKNIYIGDGGCRIIADDFDGSLTLIESACPGDAQNVFKQIVAWLNEGGKGVFSMIAVPPQKLLNEAEDMFIIVLAEKGMVASTWIVRGTEELAIKAAEELAVKLNLNLENHDLVIDRPFKVQPDHETKQNSERIWTWCPEETL